jgi:hypothetical protein
MAASWVSRGKRGQLVPVLTAALALALTSSRSARADVRACIDAHSEGQVLRDQSHFLEARHRFVSCADPACPDAIRAECANLLTDLERALPTVVLAVRDAQGRDVPGARVELDGKPLENALNGRAVSVDPGAHSFRFIAPDGRTEVIEAVALELVKGRPVEAEFDAPVSALPAAGSQPAPAQSAVATHVAPGSSHARPTLAYVLGGVGIAALAGSGYFAWSGRNQRHDLSETCAPACSDDQVSSVRTKYLLADILLGVGLGSLGAGAYFYFAPPAATQSFQGQGLMAGVKGVF